MADVALAYRWLQLTWQQERVALYGSTLPELRAGIGLDFRAFRVAEMTVLLSTSIGSFDWTRVSGPPSPYWTAPNDSVRLLFLLTLEVHFGIPIGSRAGG